MLFKDLKKVLADEIKEVVITDNGLPILTLKLEQKVGAEALLDRVFETRLSELDNFEVVAVYANNDAFSVEFKATEAVMAAVHGIEAIRSLSL